MRLPLRPTPAGQPLIRRDIAQLLAALRAEEARHAAATAAIYAEINVSLPQLADNAMQRSFGRKLSEKQKVQFEALFADADTFGDQGKYTAAATSIVQSSFEKSKNGKLKTQDASKIAKVFGDLRKMMIESVDSEGLLDAILAANPTLSQANAWATDKRGGKIIALARKYHEFREYQKQLKETPEGFAKRLRVTRESVRLYLSPRKRKASA